MTVAFYNWPYRKANQYNQVQHPTPTLAPSIVESLDIITSKGKVSADLESFFLDLHDRYIRPAHEILGVFHPPLRGPHEAKVLDEETPRSVLEAPRQRL